MIPQPNPLFALAAQAAPGGLQAVPAAAATMPAGCLLDVFAIRLTHVGVGRARAEMVIAPVHLNQRGHPQAGALVAFADAAAGWASYGCLAEGNFTTIELNCNLLGQAETGAHLVARATPVHLGRRSLVHDVAVFSADAEAVDESERRLVARFSCTQLVLAST